MHRLSLHGERFASANLNGKAIVVPCALLSKGIHYHGLKDTAVNPHQPLELIEVARIISLLHYKARTNISNAFSASKMPPLQPQTLSDSW